MDSKEIGMIEEIAREACAYNNVALYGVEVKRAAKGLVIVVFITKISGVTVEDCRSVSRYIGGILEEKDLIKSRYFLEVSSPGLERDLKFKTHYVSAIGEIIKVVFQTEDGSDVFKGILKEVLPDEIVVENEKLEKVIAFSEIKKAKTYFDYKKGVRE